MNRLYIGLVHYPVLNKNLDTIQTSVTNLDIHDIARSASTYGVQAFHIITPDQTQQDYIRKVISFWQSETGQSYNRDRSRALEIIRITDTIDTCIRQITTQEARPPLVISTTARKMDKQINQAELGNLYGSDRPLLIFFGTGHGLATSVHSEADYVLEPIQGAGAYNHLSVRSAVAIVLDRLTSAVYKGRT